MNAELLLEHFHRLGNAPDAVQRLRRFILDLAVRGKLVEQDERDEPAKALLKKIAKEKAEYPAGRKKEFTVEPIAQGEERFELPASWSWARTNDVTVYVQRGKSPKYALEKKVPVIAQKCVQWSGFQLEKAQFIEPTTLSAYGEERYVQDGDLLWNSTGHGSLGRIIVFKERFKGKYPIIVADSHVTVIRPSKSINPDYLFCWFAGPIVQDEINDKSTGTTNQTELPVGTVLAYDIPLPPLPEQHRIVAKVEELMALCDRLEAAQQQREAERTRLTAAAWQAVVQAEAPADVSFALDQLPALTTRPAQVKALRQTILDLAVRGRLTKVPISQVENETQPFNAVTDPSRPIAYGVLKPGPHDPNGIRLVKSQHIRGWRVADEIQDRITPELDAEFKRTKLQGGEVLLNLVGASIGRSAVAPQSLRGANVSRAVAVIAVAKDVLADFVVILISALLTPERIAQEATGTAQPVLNLGTLRKLDVWLPPLAEQRRIVAKVEELMALCDGLEAALESGEALRGQVLEAVVRSESGGTEPPAPVRVRQLPVPKVRAPRYEEAEVELAVAAEPVGSYDAAQVVAKRRPGRPRKSAAAGSGQVEAMIQNYLKAHPGWHGKAAILEATGVAASAWNAAIKELLATRKVERQGEKKGARYRAQ